MFEELDPGENEVPISQEMLEFQLDGPQLAVTVNTAGWEVVVKILDSMVTEANTKLAAILPGDPTMPVAHAAAFAYQTARKVFLARVNAYLEVTQPVQSNRQYQILPE